MRIATAFVLIILIAAPLMAQPIPGVYKSTDLGGTMLTGRYSESWTIADGRLMAGNTTNKMSWNGSALSTQWWMYCAQLFGAPNLLFSSVVGGNGFEIWQADYIGGLCVLLPGGPWDGGGAPYTAPYDNYQETVTINYVGGDISSINSNISFQATFIGYNDCMELTISNNVEQGSTDDRPLDLDYPGFLDTGCAATRTLGSWGDATDFTLNIIGECTVATHEKTWGSIKALYAE